MPVWLREGHDTNNTDLLMLKAEFQIILRATSFVHRLAGITELVILSMFTSLLPARSNLVMMCRFQSHRPSCLNRSSSPYER